MKPEHDPFSEPKDRAAEGRLKAFRAQVDAEDIKFVMSSKQGRRVVWRLLAKAGIYKSSFTGNSETFFNEGMRAVGLFLLDEVMRNSPDAFMQMTLESKAKPE